MIRIKWQSQVQHPALLKNFWVGTGSSVPAGTEIQIPWRTWLRPLQAIAGRLTHTDLPQPKPGPLATAKMVTAKPLQAGPGQGPLWVQRSPPGKRGRAKSTRGFQPRAVHWPTLLITLWNSLGGLESGSSYIHPLPPQQLTLQEWTGPCFYPQGQGTHCLTGSGETWRAYYSMPRAVLGTFT